MSELYEFKRPAKDEVFSDWPRVGEVLHDSIGRDLVVDRVQPNDKLGRNVVGTINGQSYACDAIVLLALWKRTVSP
jgi:hypothetical protein